jgi:hypothetical protein
MLCLGATGLDDVEGESALQLHAGSSENGTQGTCCAALLANHLADITGSNMEAKHSGFLVGEYFNLDRSCIIHKGPGDFSHQRLHFGYSGLII